MNNPIRGISFSKIMVSGLILPSMITLLFACKGDVRQADPEFPIRHFAGELDYSLFLDPPAAYRSFPFYSLNGQLTEEEITTQFREFRDAGLGGVYLHARTGLLTKYMGKEWWNVMDAAVKAAEEYGIHAWFYDEYNWPSGYGGGVVPRVGPEYRAKCLARLHKDTPLPEGSTVLAEDELYRYVEYTQQMGQDLFYGTSYVDLMNPDAVKEFINVSYLPYSERYNRPAGEGSYGIFTDEPHVHARYFDRGTPHAGVLSYSTYLADRYTALTGKDLIEDLALLFDEKDNWREVRWNYYRAKALQFEESFTKQIALFCEQGENVFTGHYLGEDVVEKVRDRIANAMLHYRNMQQPGIDHLGLTIRNRIMTAKSLSSAANQYDIPRRLSELFGISGQNMNFEDRKWIAGWHAVLGVNHFCPHLTLYSMAGTRKRDYPPTFSYHQPYWPYNKAMEDYLGRISYAATVGRYDPQFLVIHPLESAYIKGRDDGEFTSGLLQLSESLQAAHYDYDLGDEQIMADTGLVEDGLLKIGAMAYPNVILPDMIGIRENTVDLLTALAGQGGKLFNTGRFPEYLDGKKDQVKLDRLRELVGDLTMESIPEELPGYVKPNVRLDGERAGEIWSHVRRTDKGTLILLYNTSRKDAIRFHIQSGLPDEGVILWEPSEAKYYNMPVTEAGACEIEIPASSLLWLSTGEKPAPGYEPGVYSVQAERETLIWLDGPWYGRRLQDNALTLDFAAYSVDRGQTFSDPEPVIGIMNRFRDSGYSGPLELRYPFNVARVPENCRLVVENPGIFNSILVNGQAAKFDKAEYYIDRGFPVADIGKFVKHGKNEISMLLDYVHPVPGAEVQQERYGTEIESIYLVGDFAVKGLKGESTMNSQRNRIGDFIPRPVHGYRAFTLIAENNEFIGDLTVAGYPFYAGEFELEYRFTLDSLEEGKQYFIEFPNTEAIVIRTELNGLPSGTLFWSPFRTDITAQLQAGRNTLKVTLVNSLRNLLGPHHHPGAELTRVGPRSFTGAGGFPDGRGDSDWYDLRKNAEALKLWTDTYYNIPFGFLEPAVITVSDHP